MSLISMVVSRKCGIFRRNDVIACEGPAIHALVLSGFYPHRRGSVGQRVLA